METRHLSASSANQRLAAVKSFLSYCAGADPAQVAVWLDIKHVKPARTPSRAPDALTMPVVEALIRAPGQHTRRAAPSMSGSSGIRSTCSPAGRSSRPTSRGRAATGMSPTPSNAPAHAEAVSGLWTRGYFLRQASKVGPGTVAALTRLLDGKAIEAQGYRSCMNILDLGKRGSRVLLEQACRGLVDEDPHRQITYTAVKNRITALRAGLDARPTTDGDIIGGIVTSPTVGAPGRRDTSRAHLAGAGAFSLDALRSAGDQTEGRR